MTPSAKLAERTNAIQSVQRAAAILRAFGNGVPELGVNEVGRKLKLHKSTVSRLLSTLESEGLVERVPQSDKYRLGYEFVRLAGQVTHFADVRAAALSFLAELAQTTGETINLAVLDGDEVVNIDQVSGPHLVGGTNWVGRRTPLHCVANGKALLAFCSRAVIEQILNRPLVHFTKQTMTSKVGLRAELAHTRERGYATAIGELEEGLNAVAAPICDAHADVIAALSVSGPSYRMTPVRMKQYGKLTVRMAGRISARLGSPSSGQRRNEA